jgi:hypothetical protein
MPACAKVIHMQRIAFFAFYFWFSVPGGREAML